MIRKVFAAVIITSLVLSGMIGTAWADKVDSNWKYSKEIELKGENKYKAIFLDEETYQNAQSSLNDVRVADKNSEFVPYYIINGYTTDKFTQAVYNSKSTDKYKVKNDSIFDFKVDPIKGNADILGNKLVFSVGGDNFLKNIEVYGSYDGVEWHFVTVDSIYKLTRKYFSQDSVYKSENLDKSEVSLEGIQKYGYYRVKIFNNLENISIKDLKVVNDDYETQQNTYQKDAHLKYNVKQEGKSTVITLDNTHRLKVGSIHLDIEGTFDRYYEVYAKNGASESSIGTGEFYNLKFKDINIKNSDIQLASPVSADSIVIRIMNRDDKPLNIKEIAEKYYIDKLVFEDTGGGPYRLYFGNAGAGRPSYDLETYKNHIEKEAQDTASLGELISYNKITQNVKQKSYTALFNTVIIMISAILIVIVARRISLSK